MGTTNYTVNGKVISYEILADGYNIYLDSKPWIHQYEPYIPYPELSYEDGCVKQIQELISVEEEQEDKDQQIATLQEQVNMLTEAIMEMSADVYGE